MINLKIIIASTRPERKGPAIGAWFTDIAKNHGAFEVKVLDLAEINLPFLDEPNHPRFKKYTKEHTLVWSREIEEADAFIMVIPEYNYGFTAPIKNALDYLFQEWNYKPVGLVGYGGVAAGTRAIQMLKQVLTALKMMPLMESVNIPFFAKHIDETGKFTGDEILHKSALGMLNELEKWANGMNEMRKK
jgi:NAD(P)H-dependent FMN reductase